MDRKAAVAAYKEREAVAGIYAARCTATGECWVGQAPDVDTIRNRHWFGLRLGNNPHRGMQAAWNIHGAAHFTFEVLERLPAEELAYARATLLKQRRAHWQSALGAGEV
jgi:hypothetical protein